jgi:hypothetical protein
MTSTFKTLALAAAASLLVAGPALARTRHAAPRYDAMQASQADVNANGFVYGSDPYVVTDGVTYLGRDPDLQIRSQILRDETMHNGNAY